MASRKASAVRPAPAKLAGRMPVIASCEQQGSGETKRPHLTEGNRDGDPKVRAILAMSRYCQEDCNVQSGVQQSGGVSRVPDATQLTRPVPVRPRDLHPLLGPEDDTHRKQIILAILCTTAPAAGEHHRTPMVPLIDSSLRGKVTDVAFRRMLHYLREWFVVHYRRKPEGIDDRRELHVVLDCKPSDGPTLIHLISKRTAKSRMRVSIAPNICPLRKRPFCVDANMFAANNNAAAKLFDYSSRCETEEAHNYINITEEYNDHPRLAE
ncbi:hypothetical protein Q5P01_016579 [Channa striata]|uniref:Uncharacterized protein n=1 Tax=Channa striata TaxID=64152 RepID=A0AA88M8D5_CHASR|nr:hypothetical protein Q5P01_016579 [Channa striata]